MKIKTIHGTFEYELWHAGVKVDVSIDSSLHLPISGVDKVNLWLNLMDHGGTYHTEGGTHYTVVVSDQITISANGHFSYLVIADREQFQPFVEALREAVSDERIESDRTMQEEIARWEEERRRMKESGD